MSAAKTSKVTPVYQTRRWAIPRTGLTTLALASALGMAGAPNVGAHNIYHHLWSVEGKRCCNDTDCRPANYRRTPSHVEMNVDDLWLPIPQDRIQYVLLAGDQGTTRGGHWCGWVHPYDGLHTHCAILPPTLASTISASDFLPLELEPTPELQVTKVISKNGTKIVEQEFPVHMDKNGQAFTCLRPDPEEDLEVICLANPK